MDGIINVYKEKGYTSHDVVAKLRKILQTKKIGHTGTLDPDAEGVLVVCIGKGTKLSDMIAGKDKSYRTIMKLGITTDTQDLSGNVIKSGEVNVGFDQIQRQIKGFIGEYMQLPPMYSAIKVGGKKLYEYAREGKEVERRPRSVRIMDIRILDYNDKEHEVTMEVDCSKGTYIRTLLHDIGRALGCGGAMKELLRTRVGGFGIDGAIRLSDISRLQEEGRLSEHIIGLDELFTAYSRVTVKKEYSRLVHNGNTFYEKMAEIEEMGALTDYVRVYDAEGIFTGIYRYDKAARIFRPEKMLL
ncbi:MAG: tRNA pseudouridine(55) synthase TruB [Clostridiales bacterium]|nr:tRNA pseudouridine(55) synthase TruB [Clostridiales bacterium]